MVGYDAHLPRGGQHKGRRNSKSGGRRGASVVELAICLPLLVFLFVIAVDFARVYFVSITLANSARAGALYASEFTVV